MSVYYKAIRYLQKNSVLTIETKNNRNYYNKEQVDT